MNKMVKFLGILMAVFFITACSDKEATVEGRWYTPSQVSLGKQVFIENCASCHGAGAQGTKEWMKLLPDGNYPPPPLNGTAHAWHHPLKGLKVTVKEGGAKFGGVMPGFGSKLSEMEQEAAIAYFQSKWSVDIYKMWLDRGGLSK
ncbi:MAG: cytochrome c [Neptuniibacter sp.]